jgi:hypothetical protein
MVGSPLLIARSRSEPAPLGLLYRYGGKAGFGGADGGQVSPMDREEQLARFGEAVERKKEQSKEASEATGPQHSGGPPVEGDQPDLVKQGPQDVRDARSKNSGHGKKT